MLFLAPPAPRDVLLYPETGIRGSPELRVPLQALRFALHMALDSPEKSVSLSADTWLVPADLAASRPVAVSRWPNLCEPEFGAASQVRWAFIGTDSGRARMGCGFSSSNWWAL